MYQQELHSGWHFRAPDDTWLAATVPGCVHTDLRAHELIPDPFYGRNEFDLQWIEERDWDYGLHFVPAPELWRHDSVELVCEGLDTVATVRLNGVVILETENMFHRHRVDVKGHLRPGENVLEIRFGSALDYIRTHRTNFVTREFNDPVGGCTRIRKQQCQFGWDWGPRFVTCGIWRPIFLEGWSANRIDAVAIAQQHREGAVELTVMPETAAPLGEWRVTVGRDGTVMARATGRGASLQLAIAQPRLWWPAGHGDQPLYDVMVELLDDARPVAAWSRRIGLRTIELDMGADEYEVTNARGEKLNRFGFRVNGRLIFAKGANWIPAHAFVAGLRRADYEPLLRAMTDAHMNMIRLWGGGVYEHDDFYELCDELGLLIWHDFMFACTLYPGDAAFLASVGREARDQVRRIRHHASLALWCGNNELVALNNEVLRDRDERRGEYVDLFLKTLPAALAETDPHTAYIHTSPLHTIPGLPESAAPGHDEHDWNVWHNLAPVSYYETTRHRFNSEFGMQSYPSPQVAATFCPPEELNILSPTFEVHQKHNGGNAIITHYCSQLFRYPHDYRSQSYLSQLNQAICMKVAIEHFRRQQPQCLGAMYWQLNDCWPVASWSSIEFDGRWKALHFFARRFLAPALASIKLHGEETAGIGNRRRNTRGVAELWTVYDAPTARRARLVWELATLDGNRLDGDCEQVMLRHGEAVLRQTLDCSAQLERAGKENVYLTAALRDAATGEELARNTAFFTAPRFLNLRRTAIGVERKQCGATDVELTLTAPSFCYGVCVAAGAGLAVDDNFFDLYPGETRRVAVTGEPGEDAGAIEIFSLADTY